MGLSGPCMVIGMDTPHEGHGQESAAAPVTVATVTINATAEVPLPPEKRQPERDEGGRWFEPDSLVVTYAQQYRDAGTVDEKIGEWEVTAVASGPLLSAGSAARRRTKRIYHGGEGGDIPAWVGEYVDRYHPSKRS